jgi:hypothetical protein
MHSTNTLLNPLTTARDHAIVGAAGKSEQKAPTMLHLANPPANSQAAI